MSIRRTNDWVWGGRIIPAPLGIATLGIAPLGIAPFGIATLGIAPLGIAPFGIALLELGAERIMHHVIYDVSIKKHHKKYHSFFS